MNLFNHSNNIHLTFIECLLCARHWARLWGWSSELVTTLSCPKRKLHASSFIWEDSLPTGG